MFAVFAIRSTCLEGENYSWKKVPGGEKHLTRGVVNKGPTSKTTFFMISGLKDELCHFREFTDRYIN